MLLTNKVNMYRSSPSGGEPPDKRRKKTSAPEERSFQNYGNDDLWDDDDALELTTDQLKHIDEEVMLSQCQPQVSDQNVQPGPSSASTNRTGRQYTSAEISHRPAVSATNENVTGLQSLPKSQQGFQFRRGNEGFRNTSLHKSSVGFPRSKSSEFPAARTTSSAVSRSEELRRTQGKIITGKYAGSQIKDSVSAPCSAQSSTLSNRTGIEKTSEEIGTLKRELEAMQMEKMTKEGEIKNLRRMLDETKIKFGHEDQRRLEQMDQKSKEFAEKENGLEKEIQKLNTQLQFKDQDIEELRRQVKKSEKAPSCTREINTQHSPLRPAISTQKDKTKASAKNEFGPTKKVFFSPLSTAHSPKPSPTKTSEEGKAENKSGTVSKELEQPRPVMRKKRASLMKFDCKAGSCHSSNVVSRLMPSHCAPESEDYHLIGLRRAFAPQLNAHGLSGDAVFDPARIRKWIHNGADVEHDKSVIPESQHELAMHAVSELLENHITKKKDIALLEPAVLILPILDSYLALYLDMILSGPDRGLGSSVASSLPSYSSSLETYSVDSVNSHLKVLMKDYKAYAHVIERFAMNSISLLFTLVENSEMVRHDLLDDKQDSSCTDQHQKVDPIVTDANENRVHRNHATKDIQTFNLLMQLANPAYPNIQPKAFNIIETSLRILVVLAETCPREQITKFEQLLRQDVLFTLLVDDLPWLIEQKLRCHHLLLRLITAMARSQETLCRLHTDSEECLLHATCSLILSPTISGSQQKLNLGLKVIQLVVSIISSYPGGISALFKVDCQCDGDITKAVVHLLYIGLHEYRASPSHDILTILRQGVCLLNQLAVKDKLFKKHKSQIQHQYVETIIGLDAVFKESSDMDAFLEDAVQNLWDFDQEYPAVQENCTEDTMDTQ